MSLKTKILGLSEVMAFDNRWELLLHRLFFRATNLHVYRMGGIEAVVDHQLGDVSGLRTCMTSPMYRALLPLMGLPLRANVLDIGAHVGGFSLMLAVAGVRPGRFVCVEFNGPTFHRLTFNITQNIDARKVVLLRAAIGGCSGTLNVSIRPGSTGASPQPAAGKDTEQIRVLTFDEVIAESGIEGPVDVCKLDVEGAEHDIFTSGCDNALDRCRNLVIEVHPRNGRGFPEVESYLRGRNFDLITMAPCKETVALFRKR